MLHMQGQFHAMVIHCHSQLNHSFFFSRFLSFAVMQIDVIQIRVEPRFYMAWNWPIGKCSWAASSEFVSSSIPSWQILTVHAQPFRGARDLAFCLKVPLDSLLVWVSSGGSGKTARMRRLAWTFAARIGDKYQIRLTWPSWYEMICHGRPGSSQSPDWKLEKATLTKNISQNKADYKP